MTDDLYDFFFDVLKEINRTTDNAYNILENKVSALIATNSIVISIVVGLGSVLFQNFIKTNLILALGISVGIIVAIICFVVSLFFGIKAFFVQMYPVIDPTTMIELYKESDEEKAVKKITNTFAATVTNNWQKMTPKGKFINKSTKLLILGIIALFFTTLYLISGILITITLQWM